MTSAECGIHDGLEQPVFTDTTGRRRRMLWGLGWSLGALCCGYVAVLATSLAGGDPMAPGSPVLAPRAVEKNAAEAGPVLPTGTRQRHADRHGSASGDSAGGSITRGVTGTGESGVAVVRWP